MTEKHKLGRILAERAAINSKNIAYLNDKLQVKQPHNYTGAYLEKFVYDKETKKVTIYDKAGKEIKEAKQAKATTKNKSS